MSDAGRCHADGQGPCVAECCPVKGKAAPAWCRPDPHPLCVVYPPDETPLFPALQIDPDLPPGTFELRDPDGKVLGRGNVADIEKLPDGLPFPRVTVADIPMSTEERSERSLWQTMGEDMQRRMARLLEDRFIGEVILRGEAPTRTPEQEAEFQANEEQRRAEMAAKVERWRDETRRARHELARLTYGAEPVARKVLEHHSPDDVLPHRCKGCDMGDDASSQADYPCSTVALIAEHYGITMPGRWLP